MNTRGWRQQTGVVDRASALLDTLPDGLGVEPKLILWALKEETKIH